MTVLRQHGSNFGQGLIGSLRGKHSLWAWLGGVTLAFATALLTDGTGTGVAVKDAERAEASAARPEVADALRARAGAPPLSGIDRNAVSLSMSDPRSARSTRQRATPATASPIAQSEAQTGTQWLEAQHPDDYTLAIMSSNRLADVEQAYADHEGVGVTVLDFAPLEPTYRLLYNAFATPAETAAGYAALPDTLTRGASTEIMSIRELKRLKAKADSTPFRRNARTPADWPGEAMALTLQVFASQHRSSAEHLVGKYPNLSLRIRAPSTPDDLYRVVFGHFSSEKIARRAAKTLPPSLIAELGAPMVKDFTQVQ